MNSCKLSKGIEDGKVEDEGSAAHKDGTEQLDEQIVRPINQHPARQFFQSVPVHTVNQAIPYVL